jgi:hypothetical protein
MRRAPGANRRLSAVSGFGSALRGAAASAGRLSTRALLLIGVFVVVLVPLLCFGICYGLARLGGGDSPEPAPVEVTGQELGDAELPPLPRLHRLPALRPGRAYHVGSKRVTTKPARSNDPIQTKPVGEPDSEGGDTGSTAPASTEPPPAVIVTTDQAPGPSISTTGTVNK